MIKFLMISKIINSQVIQLNYEELLIESECSNIITKEKPLNAYDGRINGNKIAIRRNLSTKEKTCVLAEELGHYYTTVGNILDQSHTGNRKQEHHARLWAYNKLVGLDGIVNAYQHKCRDLYEIADYLEVTEDFLYDTLSAYQNKYGTHVKYENYIITFIPTLNVNLIQTNPTQQT